MVPSPEIVDADPRIRLVVGKDLRVRQSNASADAFFALMPRGLIGRSFELLFSAESRGSVTDLFALLRQGPASGVTVIGAVSDSGQHRATRVFVYPATLPRLDEFEVVVEPSLGISTADSLKRAELQRRMRELV
jgi:hypothetical protein